MDAYLLPRPAIVRFSGGRTSGYMLRHIVDAFGGKLPDDVHVVFSNTGKERVETLDFVDEVARRWGVRIRWVEWTHAQIRCREVDYASAARHGEPFDELLRWKRVLSNPTMRSCTQHLKIDAARHFARHVLGLDEWTSAVGIRYDEPRRWRMLGQDARNPRETKVGPLVDARVTEADIMRWWCGQPFDLRLRQHEGNCDLCFLKAAPTIARIVRDRPDLAAWWAGWEAAGIARTPLGNRWHATKPSYEGFLKLASQPRLFADEDLDLDTRPCECTD